MRLTAGSVMVGCLVMLWSLDPAQAQQADPLEELRSTLQGRLDPSDLRIQGVEVGKHTLAQVEARLGRTGRFSPGGLTELQAVCYLSSDRKMGVVFQADARDPEAAITMGRVAYSKELGAVARHCQGSAALASSIGTEGGIAVGMSGDDYLARFLRRPSEHGARYIGFYYYDPLEPRIGASGSCQLLSGVRARIVGGRVSDFFVYRFSRGRGC